MEKGKRRQGDEFKSSSSESSQGTKRSLTAGITAIRSRDPLPALSALGVKTMTIDDDADGNHGDDDDFSD